MARAQREFVRCGYGVIVTDTHGTREFISGSVCPGGL